jgi:DNA-binding protein H-NS
MCRTRSSYWITTLPIYSVGELLSNPLPQRIASCSALKNMATFFSEMEMDMARANLSSMSVEALLRLRDEIGNVLNQKAVQLQNQLSRVGAEIGNRGKQSSMKGRKIPVKYRDKQGNTWAGRGAQPVWLREKLKAGAKLEDFAVQKAAASRKSPSRKTKKRRRKK